VAVVSLELSEVPSDSLVSEFADIEPVVGAVEVDGVSKPSIRKRSVLPDGHRGDQGRRRVDRRREHRRSWRRQRRADTRDPRQRADSSSPPFAATAS
jgi:hypothetical protein